MKLKNFMNVRYTAFRHDFIYSTDIWIKLKVLIDHSKAFWRDIVKGKE